MADPNGENRHFSVTLPSDVTARLDALAVEKGTSRARVVCEGLLFWFRHLDQQRSEAVS